MVPSIKVIRILKQKKSSINYFLNYFRLGFIWVWPYLCPARAQVNPISSHTVFRICTHLRPIFALSLDAVDIQPSRSTTGDVWPPPWSTRMHIIFCLSFCSVQVQLLISLTCTAHLHHTPNEGPFVIDYSALHLHGFRDALHPSSVVDSNAKAVSFWQLMKKPPVLISKSHVLCFYEWLIIKFCGQKEPPFWHLSG